MKRKPELPAGNMLLAVQGPTSYEQHSGISDLARAYYFHPRKGWKRAKDLRKTIRKAAKSSSGKEGKGLRWVRVCVLSRKRGELPAVTSSAPP